MEYSYIVPVYNVSKQIKECVETLANQIYSKKYEIILVDDGSTDGSGIICEELEKKYNNIKTIHTSNGGPSAARNIGIKKSKGKYLIFIDGDDYVSYNMLEEISKYNTDIVCYDYINVYENGEKYEKSFDYSREYKVSRILNTSTCFAAYKRELFDDIEFPLGLKHEDDFVTPRLYYKANDISYIEKGLYYYRRDRDGSTMTQMNEKTVIDLKEVTKQNIDYFKKNMRKDEYNDFVCEVCVPKLFDYLIISIIKCRSIDSIEYKSEIIDILNNSGSKWKKSSYFKAKKIRLRFLRRTLQKNFFVAIYRNRFVTNFLERCMKSK